MTELRIGDVVSVTAKVTGIRGDGGVWIEPLGFDFDINWNEQEGPDFYTVDDPQLVRRGLMKGDERWAGDDERYVYHEDLGNGLHLVNRPGVQQHTTGAWSVMTTGELGAMRDKDPTAPPD